VSSTSGASTSVVGSGSRLGSNVAGTLDTSVDSGTVFVFLVLTPQTVRPMRTKVQLFLERRLDELNVVEEHWPGDYRGERGHRGDGNAEKGEPFEMCGFFVVTHFLFIVGIGTRK
jgi:hypothetical protein